MARRRRPLPVDPVHAVIESLDHSGRGVAHVDGKVVFIDGALAGEEVMFRYLRRRGRFDEGSVVEVLKAAPERVEAGCAHFAVCGGCSLQHMSAEAQISSKQARLLEHFEHIGKVRPGQVYAPVTAGVWGYRRKARLGARFVEKKDALLVGFREKRSNRVADLERCEVLDVRLGHRLRALRDLIAGLDAHRSIPQVELAAGDAVVSLVFRHLDELGESDRDRLSAFGQQHDLQILLQSCGPDSIVPLWPEQPADLSYRLAQWDVELVFQPTDFTQVNAGINPQMVARALELLDAGPDDTVLDLFCGQGNFSLPLAREAGRVVGVEGEEALVQRARDNASRNDIHNMEFHVANLAESVAEADWWRDGCDKLLLDPPRSGAAELIAEMRAPYPARIVYVSCDPATLARDAGTLVQAHGYTLTGAGVMDMFPHTAHVESIALFERVCR